MCPFGVLFSLIAVFTAFHLNAPFMAFLLKLVLCVFGGKQSVCVVSQGLNGGFWSLVTDLGGHPL